MSLLGPSFTNQGEIVSTDKVGTCSQCGKEGPIVTSTPQRDFCSHECGAKYMIAKGIKRNTEPAASEAQAPPAVEDAELPPAAD